MATQPTPATDHVFGEEMNKGRPYARSRSIISYSREENGERSTKELALKLAVISPAYDWAAEGITKADIQGWLTYANGGAWLASSAPQSLSGRLRSCLSCCGR